MRSRAAARWRLHSSTAVIKERMWASMPKTDADCASARGCQRCCDGNGTLRSIPCGKSYLLELSLSVAEVGRDHGFDHHETERKARPSSVWYKSSCNPPITTSFFD